MPATIAATTAVAGEDSGLASGLLNTSYQVGSSLGLALLATIAAGHSAAAEAGVSHGAALAQGFGHAFIAGGCVSLVGSVLALVAPAPRAPSLPVPPAARADRAARSAPPPRRGSGRGPRAAARRAGRAR